MNIVALMSVVAYYMNWNWAVRDVQLAFDQVDTPFSSYFGISSRITGEVSASGSTASRTVV